MWVWNEQEKKFEQKAKDYKIDRCGYSWTAKAVDFNLDGQNELIAASGFYTAESSKINMLFYKLILSNTPKWFPSKPMANNITDFSISAESRPCLFYKTDSGYSDISESTLDWNKLKASRTLVTFDFNNDGKSDLIIPEHGGITKTYINQTETKNNWVGLVFLNEQNNKINFGVKAELLDEKNNRLEYFEINPANGFKSQQDFRKIIGLKDLTTVSLKLFLNDGKTKSFNLLANQYNEIKIYWSEARSNFQ